jgi:triphosphatase
LPATGLPRKLEWQAASRGRLMAEPMPVETELKLSVAPRHVARLRNHPLFEHAVHHGSRKLRTVYYDTPTLELWRAGITLRLRRDGARWIQTIKGGGTVAAGLHRRDELEMAVATPCPEFAAIGGDLARHFTSPDLRSRLAPLFVTEFTRTRWTITPARGVKIEASVDRGVIRCGTAAEPVCEIELEIKAGPPWRTYEMALQLLEAAPLLVEDCSKAERGVALFERRARAPRKAPPSPIKAEMSSHDAFKVLVQTCLSHYIANQHGMLENDDPEYLHQMRVALRRLRSLFDTFGPLLPPSEFQNRDAEARWLSRELGEARDWDVFLTETLALSAKGQRRAPGMPAVKRTAARLRRDAARAARRAVASTRAQRLLLDLGKWVSAASPRRRHNDAQRMQLQQPVAPFARLVLDTASKRVLKRGRHLILLSPHELHRLRIAIKKLRYATDFFAALYPRNRVQPYLARLADLQKLLGIVNDAATAPRLLEAVAAGILRHDALGTIVHRNAALRAHALKRLPRSWRQFSRTGGFW